MIVIAIIRISKISSPGGISMVWQTFWQTLEACVALLMASITSFRSIFVSQGNRERQRRWEPSYSWIQRAKQKKSNDESDAWINNQLPAIPHAAFAQSKNDVVVHGSTTDRSTFSDSETHDSGREKIPLSV